ncbi:EAL domain-containing protein [Guyparkeria sp.]|uniref:EAL domain-containing protein n=1 Tax=Guyparkeria sp. TaxID=2035736 RepID=UPI0039706B08
MQADSQVHAGAGKQDTIVFLCDAQGQVLSASPRAGALFPDSPAGRPLRLDTAKNFELDEPQALWAALASGLETVLAARLDDVGIRLRITPLGEDRRLVLLDDAHRPVAHTDSLTGLPDRSVMIARIRQVQEERQSGYRLLLADIDRLKTVNDYLGNRVGDHLIRELATGMRMRLPREAFISRWSGHEFMLLIPPALAADTARIAEQVREIARGIRLNGDAHRIGTVTLSMGHAAVDAGEPAQFSGRDPLSAINAAVYQAKRSGRDRVVDADHLRQPSVYITAGALDRALHEGRIVAASQPIVDLESGEQVADESLARMITPDGDVIPAQHFIEAAARLQIAHRIDYQIIHQTISNCVSTIGHRPMAHFVNISGDFLQHPELMEDIIQAAQTACDCVGDGPGQTKPLVLEMTEREVLDDTGHALEALRPLIDFGLRLALDDFGSGYSSYRYLLDMPFTFLKIEGALVEHIHDNTRARKIVQHIQAMANDLGLTTVAEFIGDQRTADILRDIGVDWGQGFHFGYPEIVRPAGLAENRAARRA